MTAARRLSVGMATAVLGLMLTGCGSHKDDSTPALHGAGSTNNDPVPAPVVDTGNHTAVTTSGPTPGSMSGSMSGSSSGSSSGSAGGSTTTRATPGSANGFLPDSSGNGLGGGFGATPAP